MKKKMTGIVKTNKMNKSAIVEVDSLKVHPVYKKRTKVSKRYIVHNEKDAQVGDKVVIEETRPLSKYKRFQIIKIIK